VANGAIDTFSYTIDTIANSINTVSSNAASTSNGAGDGWSDGVVNGTHYPLSCHLETLVLLGQILKLGWCSLGCLARYGRSIVRVDLLNSF